MTTIVDYIQVLRREIRASNNQKEKYLKMKEVARLRLIIKQTHLFANLVIRPVKQTEVSFSRSGEAASCKNGSNTTSTVQRVYGEDSEAESETWGTESED